MTNEDEYEPIFPQEMVGGANRLLDEMSEVREVHSCIGYAARHRKMGSTRVFERVAELQRVTDRSLKGKVRIFTQPKEKPPAGLLLKVHGDQDRYWSADGYYLSRVLEGLIEGTNFVVTCCDNTTQAGETVEAFVEGCEVDR